MDGHLGISTPKIEDDLIHIMTRRDREVVGFIQSRVKNKPNLPILGIYNELKGIMVNKGRIDKELRYF